MPEAGSKREFDTSLSIGASYIFALSPDFEIAPAPITSIWQGVGGYTSYNPSQRTLRLQVVVSCIGPLAWLLNNAPD